MCSFKEKIAGGFGADLLVLEGDSGENLHALTAIRYKPRAGRANYRASMVSAASTPVVMIAPRGLYHRLFSPRRSLCGRRWTRHIRPAGTIRRKGPALGNSQCLGIRCLGRKTGSKTPSGPPHPQMRRVLQWQEPAMEPSNCFQPPFNAGTVQVAVADLKQDESCLIL